MQLMQLHAHHQVAEQWSSYHSVCFWPDMRISGHIMFLPGLKN